MHFACMHTHTHWHNICNIRNQLMESNKRARILRPQSNRSHTTTTTNRNRDWHRVWGTGGRQGCLRGYQFVSLAGSKATTSASAALELPLALAMQLTPPLELPLATATPAATATGTGCGQRRPPNGRHPVIKSPKRNGKSGKCGMCGSNYAMPIDEISLCPGRGKLQNGRERNTVAKKRGTNLSNTSIFTVFIDMYSHKWT